MEDVAPLSIQEGQHVTIDCEGSDFAIHSSIGNLTMGPHSRLQYVSCQLQEYIFPEGDDVRGTVHTLSNSTFEMQSCRVRLHLRTATAAHIIRASSAYCHDEYHSSPRVLAALVSDRRCRPLPKRTL